MEFKKYIFDPKIRRMLFSIDKFVIGRWPLTITHLRHIPVIGYLAENFYTLWISLKISAMLQFYFCSCILVYNLGIVTDTYGIIKKLIRLWNLERYISTLQNITNLSNGHICPFGKLRLRVYTVYTHSNFCRQKIIHCSDNLFECLCLMSYEELR